MSQEQMLKCEICTFQYDSKDRRPCVLVPCGHTLCKNCLDKIDNQKCPNDRQRIEKYVVNWELIKLVSANEASKQIREKLIVLAHRIEELSKLRAKTTNKLDNEIKQIEASTLKLKKNSKSRAHEYFEVKLTSLVKRVHGERDEITREEKRMRDVLESIDNDFRSTQLEQPRLVEMTFQLEREIRSIDELYNRIEEHYRVNQKTTDLLLTKLSSRTYLERLESVKSAESMDRIELERFRDDGDDDDDDDNSSLANLGLLELFETFETKKKIYVILLMTVVLPIILSYPIAMIVIAVLFRNKCLVSPQLPLWLLIYGIFGLIVSILSITLIEYLYITRKMRKSYIILSILLTLLILSSTFQVSWFFYGNYLVFSTFSQVNFEETRKPNHNYCNSTLYIFTFQAVIVPYILVFLALIVSIGVYFRKVASNQLAPPIEQVVI